MHLPFWGAITLRFLSKERKMTERFPYRPAREVPDQREFEARLHACPGGPWTVTHSKTLANDNQVIRLRWLMPQQRWCDVPTFLAFLDESPHRKLLRCFVLHARRPLWSFEALLKQIGPGVSPIALETALQFAERQGFVVAHHQRRRWSRGPQLEHVLNFGATFEWIVQAHLQQVAHAVARRGVVLKELQEQQLGDLDILAFTDDGLVITVECKSSTSRITNEHLARYLQRARAFPADIALLLIDTDKEEQITSRIEQLNVGAQYELGDRYLPNSSVVYRIMGNLYIANTGGSIATALEAALHLATTWKHTREPAG